MDKNYRINHFDSKAQIYITPQFVKERRIVPFSIRPKDMITPNSGVIMPRRGSTTNYIADITFRLSDNTLVKGIVTVCKSPVSNKYFAGIKVWETDKIVEYDTFITQFIEDNKLQEPNDTNLLSSIFTEEDFLFGVGLNNRDEERELQKKKIIKYREDYKHTYNGEYDD
jgi:hypothetical protein